ncbi:hypothetical protein Aperf_G00000073275 [Anoplocephala perfoliata]
MIPELKSRALFPLIPNHGNEPGFGGYAKKVVLSPHSTRNRFLFAINGYTALAEMETLRRCLSECVTLTGSQATESCSLQQSSSCYVRRYPTTTKQLWWTPGRRSKVHRLSEYVLHCLGCVCSLYPPCTHEQNELEDASGSILDNVAATAPSFAPSLRLGNAMNNQETKQSVCKVSVFEL